MAGKIPRHFIDDLLVRTDIVDLIDGYVPLKKAGKNYQACCPFHNEKTPSFSVSPDKQFYYCFGCGAKGNAITFLMEHDKLEFVEAIEELASRHHLSVPTESSSFSAKASPNKVEIASDHELMAQVSRYFRHQLKHHKHSQQVISYIKGRGLSGTTVQNYAIGYAPPQWDGVLKTFGQSKEARQQLLDLKVTTTSEKGKTYDFFRDRLMFPIRNRRGKVIGFGGRVLDEGQPKYLNSPETRIFKKGEELYGWYEARQVEDKLSQVLMVEGYMDVVALAEQGIHYAVASLGTSTTGAQLQLLFRTVSKVVFCYDGDRAGIDAAWRALENALPYLKDGLTLTFCFLPEGEDPDSLVQKEGKIAFEQRLEQATSFSQFLFDRLLQDQDVTSDEGKTALVARVKPMIEQIPSDFFRDILLEKLAHMVGFESSKLSAYITQPSVRLTPQPQLKITPMRRAIGLLIQEPSLAQSIPLNPSYEHIDLPGFSLLYQLHQTILELEAPSTARLLEMFRDSQEGAYLARLASWEHSLDDHQTMVADFTATIRFVEDAYLNQRAEKLLLKDKTTGLSNQERYEYQLLLSALANRSEPLT